MPGAATSRIWFSAPRAIATSPLASTAAATSIVAATLCLLSWPSPGENASFVLVSTTGRLTTYKGMSISPTSPRIVVFSIATKRPSVAPIASSALWTRRAFHLVFQVLWNEVCNRGCFEKAQGGPWSQEGERHPDANVPVLPPAAADPVAAQPAPLPAAPTNFPSLAAIPVPARRGRKRKEVEIEEADDDLHNEVEPRKKAQRRGCHLMKLLPRSYVAREISW